VNTEIPDNEKFNGWICYDVDCGFCTRMVDRWRATLASRQFELVPLQTPWVRERFDLNDVEFLAEMRLLKPDGAMVGGADALLEIGRAFWWTWPLRQLGRIPAVMQIFRAAYRWVARQRSCVGGSCKINSQQLPADPLRDGRARRSARAALNQDVFYHAGTAREVTRSDLKKSNPYRLFDFLSLLILPLVALLCRAHLAPWVFMWTMAFALYAGCKWLTYRLASKNHRQTRSLLALGYLLAWPGMNAAEFFNRQVHIAKPRKIEWSFAAAKVIFGMVLLWGIARLAWPAYPLLAGWIGMIGAVFVLHFGSFHLMSLAWRQGGIRATPVMQNPLMAKSLSDFWGARWNTAFNELAFRFTFRPLRRWTTPAAATLLVFGLSGLIHELVISLPAHGGYGLPTLYFLAQGLGVVAERSRVGQNLGLGRGLRGWLFTLLITAGPVPWLFHPPFITNVILPMLTAIGAT
jgi:predicted DCC family thiol-disulfide oxidoreductase YuxK